MLVSPLRRARETCELCGLGDRAEVCDALHEWDYGDYEGLTTAQIHERRPDWNLWRDGCPGGELPAQVGARADRVIETLTRASSPAAVFSHGHMLRVLGARWIEPAAPHGAGGSASRRVAVSVLGYEHETRILGALERRPTWPRRDASGP